MVEDLEGSGFFRVWDYFGGGGHVGSGFIIRDVILAVILVIRFRARTMEEQ